MKFNRAHNLIKKLIKCKLLFHLVFIIYCNVKMFSRRSSVINLMYSGQQFSYTKKLVNSIRVHEFHIFLAKNIWPKDILTETHLSCRKLTNGHCADRHLTQHIWTNDILLTDILLTDIFPTDILPAGFCQQTRLLPIDIWQTDICPPNIWPPNI